MSSQITMAVPDSNLTAQFYCDSLGMSKQRHGLGYDPAQAHLKFLSGPSVYLQKGGFYWKIGLTVPDLDRSVLHLKSQGVSVSQPRQFEDIGYMTHILDPAGCTIELLQQGLQAPAAPKAPVDKLAQDAGHPVAAGAILAHVTVRVRNLGLAQNWRAEQGLYILSVQPLSDYGFTLHFYAFSQNSGPEKALTAIENRPWLWRRSYTLLEVQHLHAPGPVPGSVGPLAALCKTRAERSPLCPLSQVGLNV